MAYAQENTEEYGFGASESDFIVNTRQALANPVFNIAHYDKLKSSDYAAVKMVNEQFCKNITIIRNDTQSPNMDFNKDMHNSSGCYVSFLAFHMKNHYKY